MTGRSRRPRPGLQRAVGAPTRSEQRVRINHRHNRANRTARFAWGAVVVILVGVIALIVYALTGPPASPGVVQRVPTSGAVISALDQVPAAVFDSVGVTATFPLVGAHRR